ncbi:MAG: type I-E CRISPR-associated protein Cas7/Cse4/CasC [Akkermansiaceae bacterium]|nr:type I-E CRISPR-associated protein Cas7/Cse4/CasC [Akkermansiaceae bacterium]
MKLIELHILQSFPVSCLNRDDVGSPKSALFGGTKRARISSQCLKRASRITAASDSTGFEGIRSRHLKEPFISALLNEQLSDDEANVFANELCTVFSKQDPKNENQVTTAVYLSPAEIKGMAVAIKENIEDIRTLTDDKKTAAAIKKVAKDAAKAATRNDAADIALFGRMVANDPNLNIDGAAMFSHALSTHRADNEVDFFSAVDDRKGDAEDAGAGMIGTLEFNSATYYRYAAINLDLLADDKHLGGLSEDERKDILRAFIKAVLTAVPGARKNSMSAATLPHEVLGIRKGSGQPLQLINAFEKPVRANGSGFADASLETMKNHLADIEKTWGDQGKKTYLTEDGLDTFLDNLLSD